VYKHVAAFYYQNATKVGYFRGGKKGNEIDIVVDYPNVRKILIEVKYREQAHSGRLRHCSVVRQRQRGPYITKRPEDCALQKAPCGKQMLRIPAFAFLYLLGHARSPDIRVRRNNSSRHPIP
jgi:predicted AAA+ superfamily ATPase